MSVIGYDGRIRPASTPFNAGTPNKLDPEAIGRISEAQPKFADLVMDTVSKIGGSVQRYGEAVARKEYKDDSFESEKRQFAEKKRIDEEIDRLNQDKTLTAASRAQKAKEITSQYQGVGREDVDRRAMHNIGVYLYDRAKALNDEAMFYIS